MLLSLPHSLCCGVSLAFPRVFSNVFFLILHQRIEFIIEHHSSCEWTCRHCSMYNTPPIGRQPARLFILSLVHTHTAVTYLPQVNSWSNKKSNIYQPLNISQTCLWVWEVCVVLVFATSGPTLYVPNMYPNTYCVCCCTLPAVCTGLTNSFLVHVSISMLLITTIFMSQFSLDIYFWSWLWNLPQRSPSVAGLIHLRLL